MYTNLYHVRLCSSVVTLILFHFVLCVCYVGLVEGFNQTSVIGSFSLSVKYICFIIISVASLHTVSLQLKYAFPTLSVLALASFQSSIHSVQGLLSQGMK